MNNESLSMNLLISGVRQHYKRK